MAVESMVFLSVIGAVTIAYFVSERHSRRAFLARFHDRQLLSPEELYLLFRSEDGANEAQVFEILQHVAAELSVDPHLLRPTDRFAKELRAPRGWEFGHGADFLLRELDELARKKGIVIAPKSVVTLGDYVSAMKRVY